jgi:hypothetical protein
MKTYGGLQFSLNYRPNSIGETFRDVMEFTIWGYHPRQTSKVKYHPSSVVHNYRHYLEAVSILVPRRDIAHMKMNFSR